MPHPPLSQNSNTGPRSRENDNNQDQLHHSLVSSYVCRSVHPPTDVIDLTENDNENAEAEGGNATVRSLRRDFDIPATVAVLTASRRPLYRERSSQS
jgi:hypothetical protein